MDLTTLDTLGWEALVRWQHPVLGLLSPAEFIPVAEDTGDIVAIGDWVLDRACADLAETLGRPKSKCWVSVNVSPQQLGRAEFVNTVRQALDRHALEPTSLVLEITEAALLTDTEQAAAALATLQRDGVRIAVDDFGTGFSSLRCLQDLPVDIIKIDRSFVGDTETAASGVGMLEAILALGQKLGLDMIAEGIEHGTELERLRCFGRLAGQGYLIAPYADRPGRQLRQRPSRRASTRRHRLNRPRLLRRPSSSASSTKHSTRPEGQGCPREPNHDSCSIRVGPPISSLPTNARSATTSAKSG